MLPCFIFPPIEAHGSRAWLQHLLEKARQQIAELENLCEHAPLAYAVQRFNGVGGVNCPADVFRVIKQGVEIMPVRTP